MRYAIPRKSRRLPLETSVHLKLENQAEPVRARTGNLSLGGMFVELDEPATPGSLVAFEFELGEVLVEGTGQVAWSRADGSEAERPTGMGVRFRHLSQGSREKIFRLVQRYAQDGVIGIDPISLRADQGAASRPETVAPAGETPAAAATEVTPETPSAASGTAEPEAPMPETAMPEPSESGTALSADRPAEPGAPVSMPVETGPSAPTVDLESLLGEQGSLPFHRPSHRPARSAGQPGEGDLALLAASEDATPASGTQGEALDDSQLPGLDEALGAADTAAESEAPESGADGAGAVAAEPAPWKAPAPPIPLKPPADDATEPLGAVEEAASSLDAEPETVASEPASDEDQGLLRRPPLPGPLDGPTVKTFPGVAEEPPAPVLDSPPVPSPESIGSLAPASEPPADPFDDVAVSQPEDVPADAGTDGDEDEDDRSEYVDPTERGRLRARRISPATLTLISLVIAGLLSALVWVLMKGGFTGSGGDAPAADQTAAVTDDGETTTPTIGPFSDRDPRNPNANSQAVPGTQTARPDGVSSGDSGAASTSPPPATTTSSAGPDESADPAPGTVRPTPDRNRVAADAPAPARARPQAPLQAPGARLVDEITWRQGEKATVFNLKGDGRIETSRVTQARLGGANPRLILKIRGLRRGPRPNAIEVGTREVRGVRTGLHDVRGGRELHVVFDLSGSDIEVAWLEPAADGLRLALRKP